MLRKLLLSVVAVLFTIGTAFAQTGTLTGTITDAGTGDPLPGVNVFIPDLQQGSATDADGKFTINNIEYGTYTIRATFIGYETYEVKVDIDESTVNLDIELQPSIQQLEDIVVTGAYGIQKQKKATAYQTESISSEDLTSAAPTTAAQGLVGKVAGLQINHQSSSVKNDNQIILRGMRSVNGNNEALIVIDGVIANSAAFRDLNPDNIESVDVLKGATGAALYGADASNGALVVTTKSGGEGEGINVKYKHSTMWEQVAYMPDFQQKFGSGNSGVYDPVENTAWGPRFDGSMRLVGPDFESIKANNPEYEDYPVDNQIIEYSPIEDNAKDFFNTGTTSKNTISLAGGDEENSFYMSVGNNTLHGLVPNDENKMYKFTANGTKTLGDVTLKVHSNYIDGRTNVVGGDIGDQDRALYWFVLNVPPQIPLSSYSDWQDPTSYGYANNYFDAYYQNPYWAVGTNRDKDHTKRFRGNISASWDIIDNINVTGTLGVNRLTAIGKYYRHRQKYDNVLMPAMTNVSPFVTDSESQSTRVNGNVVATGDFQLSDDFGLRTILGAALEMNDYRESSMTGNNLSIPGFFDISNRTGELEASVNQTQYRNYGIFADLELNYQEWAYLNVTGREDFTSTLPSGDNSYFYPAVGVSLILNEAIPALRDNSFISLIKLTANNSTVYKDLDPYQVNESFSQSGSFPFGSINGFYLSNTTVDDNIQKEKLNSTEFGLNTEFWNGRLKFDATYYFTKTTNLITNVSPSYASGASSYLTNIGSLSGSGVELSLGGNIIQSSDVIWNMNINYTHYQQKVDEVQPGQDEITMTSYSGGYGTYAIKGEVFPQIKAVAYERDDQGRVIIDPQTGKPIIGDLKPMGQTTPNHIFGLNTTVSYEGLTLSATADYRTGYVYYAQGQDLMEFTGRSVESAAANRQNFIFPNSSYPDPNGDGYIANTNIPIENGVQDFWTNHYNEIKENYVKDATALKLRELSVTYDIPIELLSKTKVVKGLSVGLVGRNLFTILPKGQTKFSDPEFKNTGISSNSIGIGGFLTPPPTRSYGFNVNIEF